MPVLYVVATPIGNLEDITLRALRVLREVKLIAAEDTRKTRRLLNAYDIKTPMTSYYEHNKLTKLEYILEYLKEGDVALVSDAGMPGISDPGYELIAAASKQNIPVVPLPGPSAITTALAVSGLPTDKFVYIGFLPNKGGARRQALKSVVAEPGTIIALEAPHRITAALTDILGVLGDRRIAVCRELTKLFEEVVRGSLAELASQAATGAITLRGEFVLVVEAATGRGETSKRTAGERPASMAEARAEVDRLVAGGARRSDAARQVAAATGLARQELYRPD